MEIFIHLGTNLEYFDLLNEGKLLSVGKQDREVANFFVENFPGELATTVSPQYEVNFMAIREIKRKFGVDAFNKIGGIYYGSDNCEFLVPTKKELEDAMEKFHTFNKNFPPHKIRSFTFVTSYVGDKMLQRLDEDLAHLNDLKIKNPIEVVVNDFGVLNLIYKKYKNLKPIFGRIIHKLLKTPLIDTYGYEAHPAGELIKNKSEQEKLRLRDEIVKWQLKFYNSAEINLEIYQNFLKKFGVERVALDFMEKREELYDNKLKAESGKLKGKDDENQCHSESGNKFRTSLHVSESFGDKEQAIKLKHSDIEELGFKKDPEINSGGHYSKGQGKDIGIDLYYPWAIIFTGRLCDTSAVENPSKGFYTTDDICPRTCNRYDIFYKVKTIGYNMIQRGNAGYRSELNLDFLKEEFLKNENNRLVFAPFVTV